MDFVNPAEHGAKIFYHYIRAITEAIMFTNASIQVNEQNKTMINDLLSVDLGSLDGLCCTNLALDAYLVISFQNE